MREVKNLVALSPYTGDEAEIRDYNEERSNEA
jgi:hypothetical protein